MPALTASHIGYPCWVELASTDLDVASEFYERLMDWSVTEAGEEYGHYRTFFKGDRQVAGLYAPMPDQEAQTSWSTYLAKRPWRRWQPAARCSCCR